MSQTTRRSFLSAAAAVAAAPLFERLAPLTQAAAGCANNAPLPQSAPAEACAPPHFLIVDIDGRTEKFPVVRGVDGQWRFSMPAGWLVHPGDRFYIVSGTPQRWTMANNDLRTLRPLDL